MVFKLFDEVDLLTARNFWELAIGNQGYGYKGSFFSHVVLQFLIQGGDCDVEGGVARPFLEVISTVCSFYCFAGASKK